jgi:DNA-binding HxlR family transcriptional regulator
MALPDNSVSGNSALPKIDKELTFSVLTLRARRKLLVALALGGPQTGADLKHHGRGYRSCSSHRNFLDSTLKNLKPMVEAGLVLREYHPSDRRRVLYRLSPAIIVTRDGADTIFDFGFCVAQLSADGN